MSNQNNIFKKCSKCNISHDQDLGPSCSFETEKQKRIFTKNGKSFCFNCLVSEYNINCQYCHQRVNSKNVAYWAGGILCINKDYDFCRADDRVFTCLGCDEKIRELWKNGVKPSWHSGWGPILFPENNVRKCRIVGCSQNPYYECMDLCLGHSRPCKGGKIRPDGKKCTNAMGSDEGDICEFCKNQTETYQQQKDRLENEGNQEFEKYCQLQKKAQKWWNSLSSSERERECERLLENMKLGKYWANNVYEGEYSGWAQDGSYWGIKNGKFVSTSPHLVPIQIVEEFLQKELDVKANKLVGVFTYENSRGIIETKPDSDTNPAAPTPQSITNSNDQNDNSIKVNLDGSSQLNSGKDKSSEAKNNVKTIKFENKGSDSKNNPVKPDNKTLIINLKSVEYISLTLEGDLIIKFKSHEAGQVITAEEINNNQELQKIKNACQKNGKSSLNQQELNSLIQNKTGSTPAYSTKSPEHGKAVWISVSIGIALIVGVVIGLWLKPKHVLKKRGLKN